MKYLIEHGADVNKESKDGTTPLFIACEYGNYAIVKCLVEHGANVNKELKNGKTPLIIACDSRNRNETIVKYLIVNGADIKQQMLSYNHKVYISNLLYGL